MDAAGRSAAKRSRILSYFPSPRGNHNDRNFYVKTKRNVFLPSRIFLPRSKMFPDFFFFNCEGANVEDQERAYNVSSFGRKSPEIGSV